MPTLNLTGYIEGFRLRTCSIKPGARLLCFLASVLLYNQWVVLNALYGFVGKDRWQGIEFTALQLKVVMTPVYLIKPEPPPAVP